MDLWDFPSWNLTVRLAGLWNVYLLQKMYYFTFHATVCQRLQEWVKSVQRERGMIITPVFVFVRSDSSDPESDDGDDQTARETVSSLQRRASLSSLKQGREPEEHSPELCRLGVGRGLSANWPHTKPLSVISCSEGVTWCHHNLKNRTRSNRMHGRKSKTIISRGKNVCTDSYLCFITKIWIKPHN